MSLESVEEIQAELGKLRVNLATTVGHLRLVEIMTALEQSYPDDLDLEQVGEGEVCQAILRFLIALLVTATNEVRRR